VRTAEEAISALAEDPFDLIVTDIVLPLMSGLTLTQLLKRRDSRAKAIPIVAMSAFDNASVERLARLAGCVDIIHKPLDPDTFAERVLSHLPSRTR
jgi:two-component system response regulator TctD